MKQDEIPDRQADVTVRQLSVGGLAGQTVSHYKIVEMLGAGGMGVVYKALDTRLDRLVALKFLPPEMRHNDELKRRLTEEARAASALDHPNIVVIHDIGEGPGGELFIAMAFHEGATLKESIAADGRAVLYPVYKGTYERPGTEDLPISVAGKEQLVQQYKDMARSIDYLETRTDIDRNKIGYLGVSMGAAWGVVMAALDDRLKTVVLLDGGFFSEKLLAGTDQADFAPRMKKPALLIQGKFDRVFAGHADMFRMIGAAAADKRTIVLESGHDVTEQRGELVREVVGWLDKYLGRVN